MNQVFVYHTMLFPEIRRKVFGYDISAGKIDFLPDYSLESFKTPEGHDFHTVKPNEGGKVIGRVLTLSDPEYKKLTEWEDEYEVKNVVLDSGLKAVTFVLKDDYKEQQE